jgi:hypothetical protein
MVHHLFILQIIKPYLDTDEEMFITKVKLATTYQENAMLHKTLNKLYTSSFASEEQAVLAAKHDNAGELALAAADIIAKEADELKEKYGFTVSGSLP